MTTRLVIMSTGSESDQHTLLGVLHGLVGHYYWIPDSIDGHLVLAWYPNGVRHGVYSMATDFTLPQHRRVLGTLFTSIDELLRGDIPSDTFNPDWNGPRDILTGRERTDSSSDRPSRRDEGESSPDFVRRRARGQRTRRV